MSNQVIETIHLDRSNKATITLFADRLDIDFSAVTRVDVLDIGCAWEVLSTDNPTAITWAPVEENTKLRVTMAFGGINTILPGEYTCKVVVYDPANPAGIVWGTIGLEVLSECPVAGP